MGVKSLWKILKPSAERITPSDVRLAVDASIWAHHYKHLRNDEIIYFFSKRIIKLLYHRIHPIFIFDGKAPELKRRVIEQRKSDGAKRDAADTLDIICEVCGIKMNVCGHGMIPKKEILDEMDSEVIRQMKNHQYNWGDAPEDHSSDEESLGSENEVDNSVNEDFETDMGSREELRGDCESQDDLDSCTESAGLPKTLQSSVDLDFVVSRDLSKSQKLKRLVEMRERRKERAHYNSESMDIFSELQIENLKRRNVVSHNIRVLEDSSHKRIHGDCRVTYELRKHQKKLLTEKDLSCKKQGHASLSSKTDETLREREIDEDLFEVFGESIGATAGRESRIVDETGSGCISTQHSSSEEGKSQLDRSLDSYPMLSELITRYNNPKDIVDEAEATEELSKKKIIDKVVSTFSKERSMGGFFSSEDTNGNDPEQMKLVSSVSSREIEEIFEATDNAFDTRKWMGSKTFGNDREGGEISEESRGLFGYVNDNGDEVSRILMQMKQTLEKFNIPYMTAPMESDSQCGFLSSTHVVDGVITEDNDVLLYGGVVYKNFFRKNKQIERYSLDNIQNSLGLQRKDLIMLSYLLGSDYTPGIKGIGPVKALESIKKGEIHEEEIAALLKLYLSPVIEKFTSFPTPKVCKSTIRRFYEQSHIDKEKIEEIVFFIDRLG